MIAAGLSFKPAVDATLAYWLNIDKVCVPRYGDTLSNIWPLNFLKGLDEAAWKWVAFLLAFLITSLLTVYLGRMLHTATAAAGEFLDDVLDFIGLSYDSEAEEKRIAKELVALKSGQAKQETIS
jgi:hypothetical protein